MGAPPGRLRLFGTRHSRSAYEIRDFLTRSVVEYDWTAIESDAQCRELLHCDLAEAGLPLVELHDGTVLRDPSIDDIARRLGWVRRPQLPEYDLSIYGAGPAGLSAAVYAASEGLSVVVVEREAVGGQAGTSSLIENYLGFPTGVRGAELAERARQQAVAFGAEILLLREGVRKEWVGDRLLTVLADGTPLVARANICATGVEWRRLGLPGEERMLGNGLYYGAGTSEAPECAGEHVYVVGGANSAGQAAMNLAAHAASVTMLVRGDGLSATMSDYLVRRIAAEPRIQVVTGTRIAGLLGGDELAGAVLEDSTGRREVEAGRLFVCIGGAPNTAWAAPTQIVCDDAGYVVTGPGSRTRRPRGTVAARARAVLPRVERAGRVRRGRRAARLDQTRRLRGRRGRDGRDVRAPLSRRPRGALRPRPHDGPADARPLAWRRRDEPPAARAVFVRGRRDPRVADGLGAYRALLVPDGAWRFSLAGWVARLYRVGTVVGAILLLAGTGTDYALAGAASAAIVVGSALGGPAWSRLADRVGQRPVLPLAAVCGLAAIAAFVLAVLAGAPVATWLPLALAVGAATIDPGALVRARWMHVLPDRDRRHAALALESANDELAFLLGLPAVTLAAAVAPWSGIVGAAVLGAAGLGALALLRRSIPPVAPPPERHGRLRGPGWRAWLPVGVAPALPAFVGIGMLFGYINLAGVAIADAAGTPAVAGAVIGAFSIGAVAAGLVWGVVGRRLPERARLPIATAGFVALVPLLGVAHDPLGFGVLGAVAGCGMTPLLIASVASIEGRSPLATITVAMTWPPVAMSAGNAASSTLTGVVLDGGGSPATWWIPLVAVALAIVALLVSARSPRTSRAPRIRAPQPRARG